MMDDTCEYSSLISYMVIGYLRDLGSDFSPDSFLYCGQYCSVMDWSLFRAGKFVSSGSINKIDILVLLIHHVWLLISLSETMQTNSLTYQDNYASKDQVENAEEEKDCEDDEIDHYADDTPLPKAKPMDLKALWLGETNQTLEKFNSKFSQLKRSQKDLQEGFRMFEENQNKYKLSSMRKIEWKFDHKKLYKEYMEKTRKPIEKLSPILYLNIMSYLYSNLFLGLLRMKRVSKVFNQIFGNESIQMYLAEKDYLYNDEPAKALRSSTEMCKKYVKFYRTFLYYKQMQYTEQIPQNSITKDLQQTVGFINQIHKTVLEKHSRNFTYYQLMNDFLKRHRVVIGLSSLSLTSLVLVRKQAIIAFSNYLAFNQQERSKEEITKTKYHKVIQVVEYEDYRDSLIINTKVSNYLADRFGVNFAVLVTGTVGQHTGKLGVRTWNVLVYHLHNEDKAVYLEDLELQDHKYTSARMDLEFAPDMSTCRFATIQYLNWVKLDSQAKLMEIISSPLAGEKGQASHQTGEEFSYCFFYRYEQYYIIAVPNQFL